MSLHKKMGELCHEFVRLKIIRESLSFEEFS